MTVPSPLMVALGTGCAKSLPILNFSSDGTNLIISGLPPIRKQAIDWGRAMLGWAITFLIIALIAAALGFGGLAGTAVGIAKLLFYVFLVLFVVSLIYHLITGRRPPAP